MAGHDAGGNLANCLAFIARDRGDVQIAAQALFGPMLDPSLTRLGDEKRLGSDITARECARVLSRVSAASVATHASVCGAARIARLAGLPPTLIATAQNDLLHVEAEKYASESDRRGRADRGDPLSERLACGAGRSSARFAGCGALFSVALRCARPSMNTK